MMLSLTSLTRKKEVILILTGLCLITINVADFYKLSISSDNLITFSSTTVKKHQAGINGTTSDHTIPPVKNRPCYRKCVNYNNVIVFPKTRPAGLNDRKSIISFVANLASYFCARVVVPSPHAWLSWRHNQGKGHVHPNVTWEDFFAAHHVVSLVAAGENNHDFSITEMNRPGSPQEEDSTNWRKINSTETITREFDFLYNYTIRQQLILRQMQEQTVSEVQPTHENRNTTPFIWTLPGNFYHWRGILKSHTMEIENNWKRLGGNHTTTDHVIDSEAADAVHEAVDTLPTRCDKSVHFEPSDHILETVRQIQQRINEETGCQRYGYLHIRRGDTKKVCNTSPEKMKSYLGCTFSNRSLYSLGNFPVLFSSDERDRTYRNNLLEMLEFDGHFPVLDLDQLVEKTLQDQVASGEIPAFKVNNFLTFQIITEFAQSAVLRLSRRRKISCHECDSDVVDDALKRFGFSSNNTACPLK